MSATAFQQLTDRQLDALRRLLAAALAASPDLADAEALQLVALADADAAHRAAHRAAVRAQDRASQPLLAPGELAAQLSAAVASVKPRTTSTTKWDGMRSVLAGALGLPVDAVYVTSVGGLSRNVAVRLAQSRRARQASVAVLIWTPGAEPLQHATAAAVRACIEIPRLTLLFTLDAARLDLAATVAPPAIAAPAALTLA